MARYAWKGKIVPGKLDEYIERHDNIWPELKELLKESGIRNYTIWNIDDELFGYYECDDIAETSRKQAESPVVARWDEYMKDILIMDKDPVTGAQPLLRQVFLLD